MKEISGINHIGLRVSNLEITRSFYEQLGFLFLVGPVGPEPVAIMEHPSGVNINFILNATTNDTKNILMDVPEKNSGYTHIALEVVDIESAEKQIGALGMKITEKIEHEGARCFFIRDPDNNVIEFHQPAND